MRDADDEEKTRLFDAKKGSKSAALAAESARLPPPPKRGGVSAPVQSASDPDEEATRLVDTVADEEATKLIDTTVDEEATQLVDTSVDDEPTKLTQALGSGEWLLSRGNDPPRSLSRAELFKEIAEGSLPPETYAWKHGMKEWQRLRSIPTLAPLLRGRGLPQVPRAEISPVKKGPRVVPAPEPKHPLGNSRARDDGPQSRITAVSRASAAARAAASAGDGAGGNGKGSEHTVTNSSARASQAAKDSTVLVSGSVPPSDSVESNEPLLPEQESPPEPTPAKRMSSAPPRPAAGQPPSPTELIAKAPPVVTVARTHREVTQPARARLTAVGQLTHLASTAGRQQNLVLWVLGAAGWVVAGVLGGILFAKSASSPPPPAPAVERRDDSAHQAPTSAPTAPATPAPPPVVDAAELPTVSSAAPAQPMIQRARPRVVVPPAGSALATDTQQPNLEPAAAPAPAAPPATSGDQLTSPGF